MLKNTIPFLLALSFFSCKNVVEPQEDNELITTIEITTTAPDNSVTTFKYEDLDGDGGKSPVIDVISLKPNVIYGIQIKILDKSKSPIIDLTPEILNEGEEHLVVYTFTPSTLATFNAR